MWEKSIFNKIKYRQKKLQTDYNLKRYFVFVVWMFSLHACLCIKFVSGTLGGQNFWDTLEPEFDGCELLCWWGPNLTAVGAVNALNWWMISRQPPNRFLKRLEKGWLGEKIENDSEPECWGMGIWVWLKGIILVGFTQVGRLSPLGGTISCAGILNGVKEGKWPIDMSIHCSLLPMGACYQLFWAPAALTSLLWWTTP